MVKVNPSGGFENERAVLGAKQLSQVLRGYILEDTTVQDVKSSRRNNGIVQIRNQRAGALWIFCTVAHVRILLGELAVNDGPGFASSQLGAHVGQYGTCPSGGQDR